MKKAVAPVAIIVLAVAAVLLLRTGDGPDVRDESAPGTKKAERRIASRAAERRNGGDATADRVAGQAPDAAGKPAEGGEARAKPKLALSRLADAEGAEDDDRTPAEKALASRIEAALDEENLPAAIDCAKDALECPRVEIRRAMVETLGWFGSKGLPELTPFLADSDADVRETAMSEWSMALADIEDDAQRLGTVEMAMTVLGDEDALEDISNEYIGADEKMAVESLVRIIEGGGSAKGIEKAKEAYEFVTGEEYAGRAAAERWIEEEYQP